MLKGNLYKIFKKRLHTLETHAQENRGKPAVAFNHSRQGSVYLIGIITRADNVILTGTLPCDLRDVVVFEKYVCLLNVGNKCCRLDIERARNYKIQLLACNIPIVRERWSYVFGESSAWPFPKYLPEKYSLENLLNKLQKNL